MRTERGIAFGNIRWGSTIPICATTTTTAQIGEQGSWRELASPAIGEESIITLTHPPAYILVRLQRTRASQLEGLEENVIPVEVATQSFRIQVRIAGGKLMTRTVSRHQYPMTAAYGFTDYRSQGQTIPYVIIDIATPPTGSLSLFNLYVALSRSSGRTTIRLL